MYIRCIYGILGRNITKYTVIYGEYVRFWPTLLMFTHSRAHQVAFLWAIKGNGVMLTHTMCFCVCACVCVCVCIYVCVSLVTQTQNSVCLVPR